MTINENRKSIIEEENMLCMAWVDLNTMQFMTINYSVDEMKETVLTNAKCRHGISNSIIIKKENLKLLFSAPIVEYNMHIGGSDGNAQQKIYYSVH